MQATYKMIGADGAEYGPVELTDFKNWVREGRVDGTTHVRRSDQEAWSTAASFPELEVSDRIGGAAGTATEAADPTETAELESKVRKCGSWLYWIAALTLLNSVVAFCGGLWGFYLGFTSVQVLDFAVSETSTVVRAAILGFDVLVAVGIGVLGVFACRRHIWAFAAGVVFYGLDSLLTFVLVLFGGSFIAVALHAWALVSLVIGIKAAIAWKKLQRETIA